MKVIIGYPPVSSSGKAPPLSQNRQFQWFSHETRVFPMILASTTTMVQEEGE